MANSLESFFCGCGGSKSHDGHEEVIPECYWCEERWRDQSKIYKRHYYFMNARSR